MKKYCVSYLTHTQYLGYIGHVIKFECTKRKGHFGKHCDAYGGTWEKKGKK